MLFASIFALIPLFGLPNSVGSLTAADSSMVYVRRHHSGRGVALDFETSPSAEVGLEWRRTRVTLGYSPRLTLGDLNYPEDRELLVVHNVLATLAHEHKRFRLRLAQTLTIGQELLASLNRTSVADPTAPPDPSAPGVGLLPQARSLVTASEQTSALVSYQWSARLRSELRGSYRISGGLGAEAQALQPQQRTAEASTSLDYIVSPRHLLMSTLTGSQTHTSNGFEHRMLSVSGAWGMQWSENTRSTVDLAASWIDSYEPDGTHTSPSLVPLPNGSADVTHLRALGPARTSFNAGISLSPNINSLTGDVQVQVAGRAGVSVSYERSVASIAIHAAQTLPADAVDAVRLLGGDLRFAQQATTWLSLMTGLRLQRQFIEASTTTQLVQWVVYAGAEARMPTVLF